MQFLRAQVPEPDPDADWCDSDDEDWSDRNGEPSEDQWGCMLILMVLICCGLAVAVIILSATILEGP